MKRILLLILSGVMLLASCQKDADLVADADGGMVDVTISAAMEGASATTRAISAYGTGTTVDRCILEVYCDEVLYKRMVTSVSNYKADFELRLVASQEYDFLLWADKSNGTTITERSSTTDDETMVGDSYDNYYDTKASLKEVTTTYNDYVGNDEKRDAFFYAETRTITASTEIDATLTRPFGQLNVSTGLEDVQTAMYPKYVSVSYSTKVANQINVLTGVTSGEADLAWATTPIAIADISKVVETTSTISDDIHLTTDYIFAPYYDTVVKQQLVDFSMSFYTGTDEPSLITINDNFKNIPIQRNYRTNVSGELLTKQGTIYVTIDSEFIDPDKNEEVYEVASVNDIASIITNATTESVYIKVVQDLTTTDGGSTCYVYLPKNNTVEDITLEFTTVSADTNIYIGGDINCSTTSTVNTEYAGTLNVITGDTNDTYIVTINSLYIYAYLAHVTYTGKATTGNVETSDDTFVLVEDSSIGTLTVDGGNVEIQGEVTTSLAISGSNSTTSSIAIYGTVTKVEVDDSATATGTITLYDDGKVNNGITDTDNNFTVSAVVSEGATEESALLTFTSFLESTTTSTLILSEDITLSGGDTVYTTESTGKTIITSGQIILDDTATLTNVDVNYTGTETFIVPAGAEINTLTITSGNVEVYGTVGAVAVATDNNTEGTIKIYDGGSIATATSKGKYSIYHYVSTGDELQSAVKNSLTADRIIFLNDIEITDDTVESAITIDRNNLIIQGNYYTLSGYAQKNLIQLGDGATDEDTIVTGSHVIAMTITQSDEHKSSHPNNGIYYFGNGYSYAQESTVKNMGRYGVVADNAYVIANSLTTQDNSLGGMHVTLTETNYSSHPQIEIYSSSSFGEDHGYQIIDDCSTISNVFFIQCTWYKGYYNRGDSENLDIQYIYSTTEFTDCFSSGEFGDGTSDDPFIITMASQLSMIGSDDYPANAYYKLGADIDMSSVQSYYDYYIIEEILGELDGDNHKLYNITSAQAFIGSISGTVKNLTLEGVDNYNAGLARTLKSGAYIYNVDVTGVITYNSASSYNGQGYGGIAVASTSSADVKIENCDVDINMELPTAQKYIGGIVGKNTIADTQIIGCSVSGTITGSSTYTGGVVGYTTASIAITDCTITATINGATANSDNIVGYGDSIATITNAKYE